LYYKNQDDKNRMLDALRMAGLPEEPPLPLPDKPSIAVLPFTNMSDDPKQEYFADGMTDDLITDLSKISGLFVIARNSVFTYKGKAIKVEQVGRELGVRHILEGSVRKVGNQVRINAQLIDAATGGHLWAERYDGKIDDIFALQDKITGKIVSALAIRLTAGEKQYLASKGTDNVEAYDEFLKGWSHYLRWSAEDHIKAISHFKKAIEVDPNYGMAYAGLAHIFYIAPGRFYHSIGINMTEAKLKAREYLKLAMKNPTALAYRIKAYMNIRLLLYEEAISEAERAIALAPNDPMIKTRMAYILNFAGRPEEAIGFAEAALRRDPLYMGYALFTLGQTHFCLGNYEKAVNFLERSVKHNPDLSQSFRYLSVCYSHLGRKKEARSALDKFITEFGLSKLVLEMAWVPFKDQKVFDRFAQGLIKAGYPEPHKYFKINTENRLKGEEIRNLLFGRKRSGISLYSGMQWWKECDEEGKCSYTVGSHLYRGIDSIEEDLLCIRYEKRWKGMKMCGSVFRNPEGTLEGKDEYLYHHDVGISPFSMID